MITSDVARILRGHYVGNTKTLTLSTYDLLILRQLNDYVSITNDIRHRI
jgi:hypothetical protein